jgi:hypothetical protein
MRFEESPGAWRLGVGLALGLAGLRTGPAVTKER